MNTKVEQVIGITNGVTLKLGDWSGTINFTIVPMEDFEIVLGKEILTKAKAAPMPQLDYFIIFSGQDPYVIPTIRKERELVSTMTSLSMVSTIS